LLSEITGVKEGKKLAELHPDLFMKKLGAFEREKMRFK